MRKSRLFVVGGGVALDKEKKAFLRRAFAPSFLSRTKLSLLFLS